MRDSGKIALPFVATLALAVLAATIFAAAILLALETCRAVDFLAADAALAALAGADVFAEGFNAWREAD